jgi:hypothetical protein
MLQQKPKVQQAEGTVDIARHCMSTLQGAHEMILEMIAWRDPNVIKIAAFYGDDLKVNYAGKLASDPHPLVSWPAQSQMSASRLVW